MNIYSTIYIFKSNFKNYNNNFKKKQIYLDSR